MFSVVSIILFGGGVSYVTITYDGLNSTIKGSSWSQPQHHTTTLQTWDLTVQGPPPAPTQALVPPARYVQTCLLWGTYGWQAGCSHPNEILSCGKCHCDSNSSRRKKSQSKSRNNRQCEWTIKPSLGSGKSRLIRRVISYFCRRTLIIVSSGSSGRVRGGKKHEIYVATFGGHLFYDLYFYRAGGGGMAPSAPPWIRYW